ncbi:MAG TPA: hypothetical protein V6D20_24650 [Candidatus Obscuribacterales bacterium]
MTVKTTLLAFTLGTLGAIAPTLVAIADPVVEAETTAGTNDSFATREMLPSGASHVLGSLSFGADLEAYDYQFSGQLSPDEADFYTIPDLPSNQPFYVWIDNTASGVDTVLGVFDGESVLQTDDDGSPVGSGLASATGGTVSADGTIRLGVSGFPDFNFDGMYDDPGFGMEPMPPSDFTPQGGDYSVYVQLGTNSVANVDAASADYTFTETLIPGEVGMIALDDLPAGEPFVVWIDNSDSGIDTMVGIFDPAGDLVDLNDDGSPVGNGLGSILTGFVSDDGSVDVRVTLFPDFDFTGEYMSQGPGEMPPFEPGPHGVEGEYELYVKLGIDSLPGDIDFLVFPDLTPGSEFVAEVTLANFDPVLGWFDDEGQLITVDDDGGEGVYPRMVGTVPPSGSVTLAVSSFPDFEFDGSHQAVSDYVVRFEAPSN